MNEFKRYLAVYCSFYCQVKAVYLGISSCDFEKDKREENFFQYQKRRKFIMESSILKRKIDNEICKLEETAWNQYVEDDYIINQNKIKEIAGRFFDEIYENNLKLYSASSYAKKVIDKMIKDGGMGGIESNMKNVRKIALELVKNIVSMIARLDSESDGIDKVNNSILDE